MSCNVAIITFTTIDYLIGPSLPTVSSVSYSFASILRYFEASVGGEFFTKWKNKIGKAVQKPQKRTPEFRSRKYLFANWTQKSNSSAYKSNRADVVLSHNMHTHIHYKAQRYSGVLCANLTILNTFTYINATSLHVYTWKLLFFKSVRQGFWICFTGDHCYICEQLWLSEPVVNGD